MNQPASTQINVSARQCVGCALEPIARRAVRDALPLPPDAIVFPIGAWVAQHGPGCVARLRPERDW